MTQKTSIEWTDATWNPIRGCSRTSPGCENCYAERIAARFAGPGQPFEGFAEMRDGEPRWTRRVALVREKLEEPLRWRKPRTAFVNSTSDLFHEALSDADIAEVFGVMAVAGAQENDPARRGDTGGRFHGRGDGCRKLGKRYKAPWGWEGPMLLPIYGHGPHIFQVLTKRARRARELLNSPAFRILVARAAHRWAMDRRDAGYLSDCIEARDSEFAPGRAGSMWPLSNVWLGVSAEDQQRADERIPELLETPAAVRFVSYEPALGPIRGLLAPRQVPGSVSWMDSRRGPDGELHAEIDWVIAGAESGPDARPMSEEWVRAVRDQCAAAGVSFFYKQKLDGRGRKVSLPLLDGQQHAAMPGVER